MGTERDSLATKNRIIASAGRLFAERGFKAVTVRDIAAAAQTQISAVNYHFRSKEQLYREVVGAACRAGSITDEEQAALLELAPDAALRLVLSDAERARREQHGVSWQSALLARELRDPSPAFAEASEEYFQPQIDFMAALLGRVVGKAPDDACVRLAVISTWTLFDTFLEYGHLVESASPGLVDRVLQGGNFAEWLYDLAVHIASGREG